MPVGTDSYEFDYLPGYTKPTHQFGRSFGDEFHAPSDDELLASYAAFTQRGVTLAGGQGVLPTGCALAQHTASKQYFVADPAATDGRQNVLGLLRTSRDTGGFGGTFAAQGISGYTFSGDTPAFPPSPSNPLPSPCLGNLVIRGIVNVGLVSGQDTTSLLATGSWGAPPVSGPGGVGSAATGVYTLLHARVDPVAGLFIF